MDSYDLGNLFKKQFKFKGFISLTRQLNKNDLHFLYGLMTGEETQLLKEDYVNFYLENYDHFLHHVIYSFHQELLDYIFNIVDHDGEIEFKNENPGMVVLLKLFLIAFPVIKDGQNKLIIANEVLDSLKNINRKELYQSIEVNNLVIKYTRALLSCYGEFEINMIFNYLNEYENLKLDINQFYLLLNNDSLMMNYEIKNEILYIYQIEEVRNYFETREKNKNLDYYHLTKEEITEGFKMIPEEKAILDFFEDQLGMPTPLAKQGLDLLLNAVLLEMPEKDLNLLLKQFDISGFEHKQLEQLVHQLAQNTRLWSLKGHTRKEIKIPKMIKFPTMK